MTRARSSERDRLERILRDARTVAVLGAHPEVARAAHFVPTYLYRHGYRILPVNPQFTDRTMWDEPVRATLPDLNTPVDIVEVFRRPEHLPGHLPEILAMEPRPGVVWFQHGIRHDEVARELEEAGLEVVQSRCMLVVHKTLGIGGSRPEEPEAE